MNPVLFKPRSRDLSEPPLERAELTAHELTDQYLQLVYSYVARRIAPRQEAEDVTAEVFSAALQSLPRFRGECSVRAWLLAIARRKVTDNLRRRGRQRETVASQMTPSELSTFDRMPAKAEDEPEAVLQRTEAARVLRELLAELTGEQQEAVRLQYQGELSVAEIAIVMGRSTAAVTGLLQRARATLFRTGRSYFLNEETENR